MFVIKCRICDRMDNGTPIMSTRCGYKYWGYLMADVSPQVCSSCWKECDLGELWDVIVDTSEHYYDAFTLFLCDWCKSQASKGMGPGKYYVFMSEFGWTSNGLQEFQEWRLEALDNCTCGYKDAWYGLYERVMGVWFHIVEPFRTRCEQEGCNNRSISFDLVNYTKENGWDKVYKCRDHIKYQPHYVV